MALGSFDFKLVGVVAVGVVLSLVPAGLKVREPAFSEVFLSSFHFSTFRTSSTFSGVLGSGCMWVCGGGGIGGEVGSFGGKVGIF